MQTDPVERMRAMQQWLADSTAEARRLLPDLIELPAPLLSRELRTRPELRTPGVIQLLVTTGHDAIDRLTWRAHELLAVAVSHAAAIEVPLQFATTKRAVQVQAWLEYGRVLRVLGHLGKARRALKRARSLAAMLSGRHYYLAMIDLVEAPLLYDLGEREEALTMIGLAARQFAVYHDAERLVEARLIESSMILADGDSVRAAEVWNGTHEAARNSYDSPEVTGRMDLKIGLVELRDGNPAGAARLLASAVKRLHAAGLPDAAIRARSHYADACAARGRVDEALSEYRLAYSEMLLRGGLVDAASTAIEIADLLLTAGRTPELPPTLVRFVHTLRDAGLTVNALEPFAYLRARAESATLTRDDLRAARAFFGDLRLHPYTHFIAPN